jgi:hypothetical protein
MNDRHVDHNQVAVVRATIRQALSTPTLMAFDPLAIAVALASVESDIRKSLAAMGTDTFATLSNL